MPDWSVCQCIRPGTSGVSGPFVAKQHWNRKTGSPIPQGGWNPEPQGGPAAHACLPLFCLVNYDCVMVSGCGMCFSVVGAIVCRMGHERCCRFYVKNLFSRTCCADVLLLVSHVRATLHIVAIRMHAASGFFALACALLCARHAHANS